MSMSMYKPLFVAATLLGSGMVAHAETLAGVTWAMNQDSVICYLFNTGPGTVDITGKAIFREGDSNGSSGLAWIDQDNCGPTLAAGAICAFGAKVPVGGANACRAVLSPSGANVRGEMQVRNAQQDILVNVGLR